MNYLGNVVVAFLLSLLSTMLSKLHRGAIPVMGIYGNAWGKSYLSRLQVKAFGSILCYNSSALTVSLFYGIFFNKTWGIFILVLIFWEELAIVTSPSTFSDLLVY